MTDNEKYKLGELNGRVESISNDLAEVKSDVKTIGRKLDNIKAVSEERWEKRNKHVDAKLESHDARISALEDDKKIESHSFWAKILKKFDDSFSTFLAYAILGALIWAIIMYSNRSDQYADMIKHIQEGQVKQ